MNEVPARSVENLTAPARVNDLYRAIGHQIQSVLFHSDSERTRFDPRYYVSRRSEPDQHGRMNFDLDALPQDIQEAWKAEVIGIAELQLLDFLLNSTSPRLATLIGKVGTGKTTFLRNVAYNLSSSLPSLRSLCFVYLDFLKLSEFQAETKDVFDLLITQTQAILRSRPVDQPFQIDRKRDFYKFVADLYTRIDAAGISDINRYLNKFKSIFDLQLVLLFDNIDQLRPEFAAQVVALARSIFFATNQSVIIAIRPVTDALRLVSAHGNESYIPYALHLSPPDIAEVLRKRMAILLQDHPELFTKKEVVVDYHGFSIRFDNVRTRMATLFKNILRRSLQDKLYVGLCNYSLRRLFFFLDNILKYRELSFNVLFQVKDTSKTPYILNPYDRRFLGHLIEAGMVGDRQFYTDVVDTNVIANLYFFQVPTKSWSSHCLAYHLLSFYDAMRAHVRTNTVLSECAAIGYNPEVVERVIGQLVRRGLLDATDAHGGDRTPTHAKISDCGKFYIREIIDDNDYLLTVIADTDLAPPQVQVTVDGNIRYVDRVRWVSELLTKVATQEKSIFEQISRLQTDGRIIGTALLDIEPLTLRLLSAIDRLCAPRKSLRFGDLEAFNQELSEVYETTKSRAGEPADALTLLVRRLKENDSAHTGADSKIKFFTIHGLGTVRLSYPQVLEANKSHTVKFSLKPLFDTSSNRLMGLWMSDDSSFRHAKYFALTRTSTSAPFRGEFRLGPAPNAIDFPKKSDVTLFDAAAEVAAFNLVA